MYSFVLHAMRKHNNQTSPRSGYLWLTCLTVSLAALGCSSIKVGLGARVRLEKTAVTTMSARLATGTGIAPGQRAALVVSLAQPDGKVLLTEGKGGGKVMWNDLTVYATVVEVNDKGILYLHDDPRLSEGKSGHVVITARSHPDLHAELDIPIRYDAPFVANFSGSPGSDGMSGMDGTAGSSGSMGSMDPNSPSPGGNGGNGTDGSDGKDGGAGGNAPNVLVRVTLRPGAHPTLEVSVTAEKQRKTLSGRSTGRLANSQSRRWSRRLGRKRRARRKRRIRRHRNSEREQRLGWTRRSQRMGRFEWTWRKHPRGIRSGGQAVSRRDSPIELEWA